MVRVPASTSNLGPGFDCLGVALRIYNKIDLARGASRTWSPIVNEAAARFFEVTDCAPFQFSCDISGDVPVARGLGSSATLRVGVLHGLNVLTGAELRRDELFGIAAELEGHPDNAAPATFGGFTVTCGATMQRFRVSSALRFVLLIPDFEISTGEARALLPKTVPHPDAVRNVSQTAAIVAAFASHEYSKLRGCFRDTLHQPYRHKLVPFLADVIEAAINSGALGAFLSGSGSAICAVTLDNQQEIADAMLRASRSDGARTLITRADNHGSRLLTSNIR